MQFLPSAIDTATEAVSQQSSGIAAKLKGAKGAVSGFAALLESFGNSQGGKLASFITAGRTKYTGVPEGFAAFEEAAGTVGLDKLEKFKSSLKKRNIQEASLDSLNQLMASGAPMTVSRIFSTLTGHSRASAELDDNGRMHFSQLMQKLGFSQDEAKEMLELSDTGRISDLMKRVNEKVGQLSSALEDGVEVNVDEFASLLDGLDLTEKTRTALAKLFGNNDSLVLNRESLQALMAEANNEIAGKDLAAKAVAGELRGAMDEAMKEAKLLERTAQVADTRGSRLLESTEAIMQETIHKKLDDSGHSIGKLAEGSLMRDEAEAEGFENSGDGTLLKQDRAAKILRTNAHTKPEETREAEAAKGFEKLVQRIDLAASGTSQPVFTPAQGGSGAMAGLASAYRQEIFTQVENGILQSLSDGQQRLTLQLNPEELGQVTVILTMHQNELRASIKTDNQESAAALGEQLEALRTSLEEQGLKVAELDVQCHMQDNPAANQWNGESQHNLMHDEQERARMVRLARMRREEGTTLEHVLERKNATALSEAGLHIIA